jgi:hypothetical protein
MYTPTLSLGDIAMFTDETLTAEQVEKLPTVAILTSGMVTENASELVVEVQLKLDTTGHRLVDGEVRYIQSTPSLQAIRQMVWALQLEPDDYKLVYERTGSQAFDFTRHALKKIEKHYSECTQALFKRRPWMPDHKPYLANTLVLLPDKIEKLTWVTTRRISTYTHPGDTPNLELPLETGPSAPDD